MEKLENQNLMLPQKLANAKRYSTYKFALVLSLVPGLVMIVFMAATFHYMVRCNGCENTTAVGLPMFITVCLCTGLIGVFITWKVRREPDPLGIRQEIGEAVGIGSAIGLLWFILVATDPGNLYAEGRFNWEFFAHVAIICMFTVVTYRQIYKSYSEDRKSIDDKGFKALLESEIGRQLFKGEKAQLCILLF